MEKQAPLTINAPATKQLIRTDGRTLTGYARARKINTATFARIVAGLYPHTDNLDSEYQKALHCLQKDGLLVGLTSESQAA
jgi:hypothetical protein